MVFGFGDSIPGVCMLGKSRSRRQEGCAVCAFPPSDPLCCYIYRMKMMLVMSSLSIVDKKLSTSFVRTLRSVLLGQQKNKILEKTNMTVETVRSPCVVGG